MVKGEAAGRLSYAFGAKLEDEEGIGALTLGGYLREVTQRYGPREAAVLREGDRIERWTYDDLWARSVSVARALIACGVSKGTRVGVLMTNRPEFLSAVFGTALMFTGAWLNEKTRDFQAIRGVVQFLALLPMAVRCRRGPLAAGQVAVASILNNRSPRGRAPGAEPGRAASPRRDESS